MRSLRNKQPKEGWTLVEMLVALPVTGIAMLVIFSVIWGGTRLVTRNLSVNLAHMNVVSPMQRLSDDLHMAIAMPQLTNPLAAGAKGTVPGGCTNGGAGSTKSWSTGKMTPGSYSLPIVLGSGPAAGIQLYLLVGSTYSVNNAFGPYNANKSGFAVAAGSYAANSTTINIEVGTSADEALLISATKGMHLCIPSVPVLITGSNSAMLDKIVTSVNCNGTLAGGTANTRIATCTVSGTLGVALQTFGTRSGTAAATVLSYLVAPVNYFVCGSDMIRLNYDGNWETVMRNVLPTSKKLAQAIPFSMPWPYNKSFLSNSKDGQRAVSVRLTASNPDYTTDVTLASDVNSKYRGVNSDMVLYDVVIWSRMQLFDEMAR